MIINKNVEGRHQIIHMVFFSWIGTVVILFWIWGLIFSVGGLMIQWLLLIAAIVFIMDMLFRRKNLGFTALGTSFSMRNDLPVKLGLISEDTFNYAKKGAKIMIKHKWMEEPPQMEDRNQLKK